MYADQWRDVGKGPGARVANMRIIIGSDHGGFDLKNEIASRLRSKGDIVVDAGCYTAEAVDYPDVAESLCIDLLGGEYDFGILICGTGIGISIAANKIKGIRAAHLSDAYSARMAREHNDANVITLGARTLGTELAWSLVEAYMDARFQGGVHEERIRKIAALEEGGRC